MRLHIAGGCGEHGRNCFHVMGETTEFLVDCGLMAGEPGGGFPRLDKRDIPKLKCVFLTHSHAAILVHCPGWSKMGLKVWSLHPNTPWISFRLQSVTALHWKRSVRMGKGSTVIFPSAGVRPATAWAVYGISSMRRERPSSFPATTPKIRESLPVILCDRSRQIWLCWTALMGGTKLPGNPAVKVCWDGFGSFSRNIPS